MKAKNELPIFYDRAEHTIVDGHRDYNNAWHTAIDLYHLITVSKAITLSAISRKESRGAHFRKDYPEKDDSLSKLNTVIYKGADEKMQVKSEPLPEIHPDLQKVIEEMK
jgi:succinate dehydrogenase / fumarate reductase flavoprotein subunit